MKLHEKKYNIIIYNTLCSKRVFDDLFNQHNVTSGNAAQGFYALLADGLAAHKNVTVTVHSLLPVNAKEQNKRWWKQETDIENNIMYKTIPILNIAFLRNIGVNLYVFFQILFKRFPADRENVIITDFLRLTLNLSVVSASKIRGIKTLTVITDMPGENVLKQTLASRLKDKFAVCLSYDYYVCVTRQLNERLNRKNKPAVIIESFADIGLQHVANRLEDKFEERVLVYAGSLYERYGLKTLIGAFMQLPDQDLKLFFYGVGPFRETIDTYHKQDHRIEYRGVLNRTELMDVLFRATLLVNPRPGHEIYTLYSFPSKNIEYMSTGTPLLTTKLAGIPEDHYPYIYIIEDETVEGVKTALIQILKMDRSKIHTFGQEAKAFVMREKNNINQAAKIISIMDLGHEN